MEKKNNCLPEDIKPEWLNFVRALQAACSDNNGYGILRVTVAVNKNKPVIWRVPSAEKLSPKSVSEEGEFVVEPGLIAALAAMMG